MCAYLHISMIRWLFLLTNVFLPYLVATCVSKGKSSKKGSSSEMARNQSSSHFPPNKSNFSSMTVSSSEKSSESERNSRSEKSSRRSSATDSLKVPRSAKVSSNNSSNKSSRSKKGDNGSDTDSAKTELIEVPIGKAAKDNTSKSILTPSVDLKTSSVSTQNQRVSFAEPLKCVKRRAIRPKEDDEKTSFIP